MSDKQPSFLQRFMANWRSALVAGILVLAPIAITIVAFVYLVNLSDALVMVLPSAWRPEQIFGFSIPGLGILLAITVISIVGLMTRNYIGRRAVKGIEYLFDRLPVIRGVYNSIKQLIDTLLTPQGKGVQEVVIIEYPRKGIWCFAFLTNQSSWLTEHSGRPLVNLFLPSTPNPTTGFYLLIPVEDVYQVNIKADQAFKLIMSAGIVAPRGDFEIKPYALKKNESASLETGNSPKVQNDE